MDSYDPLLLTKEVEGFGRFFREADDAARAHGVPE